MTKKSFLDKKIACYRKDILPSEYYACVRRVDEKLIANADYLKTKFGELEVTFSHQISLDQRKTKCIDTHQNFPDKINECKEREMGWFREAADQVYSNFYKKQSK